ncbi:phospholipase A2 inhibitor and Ly6/PLAUR domain-containing protein isoform A [Alligator mississippiensis]|uniref:Phospholipase A2 inhibitor and Ly6/PLAUR domain-containing protein isoform A n=1 Tax=Alligator mississippiensis TaxID=8496 RepID=A0A151MW19_ALLMI|nr:phospholipase A2 inhibitor and Ly6/PLAUR domain-containing protein isoform A [Alligator mississippiensis]
MLSPLALGLLAALLGAGSPLSCHRCNGTGLTCTGPLVPCAPLQDACFTLTSETHIGGTPGKVDTFKGCTARTLCPPRSSTLSAGAGVRLRGGSVCCSHDGCNRGAVKLPLAPGVLTGRWCPGCAVEGPACKPKERVPCRDHEDQCLYVAGAIHVGSYNYSYALGGCATRSACVSAVGVYEHPSPWQPASTPLTTSCTPLQPASTTLATSTYSPNNQLHPPGNHMQGGSWKQACSALRCEECFAFTTACSGPVLPCDPGEGACVSGVGHYTLGEGRTLSVAVRSCLEPSSCSQRHFSLTFRPGMAMRMNFTCCHQDGCNTGVVELPSVSSTSNGRSCPSCFAEGADHCDHMTPLPCTGEEDHCFEFTGTITAGNASLTKSSAGCAAPGACRKRVGVTKYARGVFDTLTRAVCYPAPRDEL